MASSEPVRQLVGAFHEGEIAVQERAGARDLARRTEAIVRREMPPVARQFLAGQRFAVLAGRDREGRVWASLVAGEPGFLAAPSPGRVEIACRLPGDDPLAALADGAPLGLLAIDPSTRRRMKVKGRVWPHADGLHLEVERAYALCSRHIRQRQPLDEGPRRSWPSAPTGDRLDRRQRQLLAAADTFFVASHHPLTGADAAHRGGPPGVLEVVDGRHLRFPDYPGNHLFNTLGNLHEDPSIGLLVVDWRGGGALQLTGRADVVWHHGRREAEIPRHVEVEILAVRQAGDGLRQPWRASAGW